MATPGVGTTTDTSATPAAPAESTTELRVRTLESLTQAIEHRSEEIRRLRAALEQADLHGGEEALADKIKIEQAEIQRLRQQLGEVASGVSPEVFEEGEDTGFDIAAELRELLAPLLREIRRATERPRAIDRLGREIERLTQELATAEQASKHVAETTASVEDRSILNELKAVSRFWLIKTQQTRTDLQLAEQQLARLQAGDTSLYGTAGRLAQLFFRSRGRNLALAIAAMIGCWALMRLLHAGIRKTVHQRRTRDIAMRVFDLAYMLATATLSVMAFLFVLYAVGDWVLLSLASLFLLGLAWASKTTLPRVWRQAILLLNLGAVREGERILYQGVPWRVDKLGPQTYVSNPDLTGGTLRLPLAVVADLQSRPFAEGEPWFPTRKGDWLLLDDGTHARVIQQTPELVILVRLGGARSSFRSEDFFSTPPTILSAGFRIALTFGIDYQHQAISTGRAPNTLRESIQAGLEHSGHAKHLLHLTVEFLEAGASSLDLAVLADFAGDAAPNYFRLRRMIAKLCVDTCNEQGWVIPFTQVTMHMAAPPPSPDDAGTARISHGDPVGAAHEASSDPVEHG